MGLAPLPLSWGDFYPQLARLADLVSLGDFAAAMRNMRPTKERAHFAIQRAPSLRIKIEAMPLV